MRLNPAMRAEVHKDTGGEQANRNGQRSKYPGRVNGAAKNADIEDAEDEDEHGGFREEGGAAARGNDQKVRQGGVRLKFCSWGDELEAVIRVGAGVRG